MRRPDIDLEAGGSLPMRHGTTPATILIPARLLAVLAIPALACAGEPNAPERPTGERANPLLLLNRPDVRSDLKLTAEQADGARRLLVQLHEKAAALKGRKGAEVVAARRQIDEEMQRWLDRHLSAEQRARLYQVELQWEGPSALHTRPTVAQSLGLTDEQRQAIAQAASLRNSLREQGRCHAEDEQRLATQILATLTSEQKERWQALLGPAFVVQTAEAATAGAKR
jgi:hypothetical protein